MSDLNFVNFPDCRNASDQGPGRRSHQQRRRVPESEVPVGLAVGRIAAVVHRVAAGISPPVINLMTNLTCLSVCLTLH
jgi:hypothetical protein